MKEETLYEHLLNIALPWHIHRVDMIEGMINVFVKYTGKRFDCPICHKKSELYRTEICRWYHVGNSKKPTIVHCDVPITRCKEHGMSQIEIPWAELHQGFSKLEDE